MDERIEELTFFKEASVDDKLYYLFQTTKGEYRLVEAKAYQSFHLKPGMTVNARVRKKGCAGEEISELLHPTYTQSREYFFRIERTGSLLLNNDRIHFLVVADAAGNEYKIRVNDASVYVNNDVVKCRLEDQTDGRLRFIVV
jgi:hypothetical protein